jgi:hypothetical protein
MWHQRNRRLDQCTKERIGQLDCTNSKRQFLEASTKDGMNHCGENRLIPKTEPRRSMRRIRGM